MTGRRLIVALPILGLLLFPGCQDKPSAPPKAKSYGSKPNLSGKKDRLIRIDPDKTMVSGCLSSEILRRVILMHKQEVKDCYVKGLSAKPELAGRVHVKITVVHDGTVKDTEVVNTTLNDAQVEKCLIGKILGWKFPSYRGGGECVVNYPFVFKPE